jgi:hypothetical protein
MAVFRKRFFDSTRVKLEVEQPQDSVAAIDDAGHFSCRLDVGFNGFIEAGIWVHVDLATHSHGMVSRWKVREPRLLPLPQPQPARAEIHTHPTAGGGTLGGSCDYWWTLGPVHR